MVLKRPFVEEDSLEVPYKQIRQAEHSVQCVLSSEPSFPEDAALISNGSGEGRFSNGDIKHDEKFVSSIDAKHPGDAEYFEANVAGFNAIISLGTCSIGEEDSWLEEPLHIPSFGECSNSERQLRTLAHLEDVYSLLLQCPPRKPFLVGPNYQADVPEWDSQVARNTSKDTDASETATSRYENELMGTCIIPMPAFASSAYDDKVGSGRTSCSCEDKDSLRCVRQHILEAREELRKSLGHETFMELGFCDMGEIVAEKWSEEEEQLFHKIVFSNPASLGRNFWDSLASVFPYRTKEDIVSYYFNVFMLWKRSEQNRCKSMSIDSDNDEWQGTDGFGNNEVEFSDDDEDLVVESPVCQEDFAHQNEENGLSIFDEDAGDETCDNHHIDFGSGEDARKISETFSGKLFSNCCFDPAAQMHEDILKDVLGEQEEREVQDDSCTSSDTGSTSQESQVMNADNGDQWQGNFNELNNGGSHGYLLEPCDTKPWGAGYPTCQKNKIDFLPTCSMIEEVFGDRS